jgi:hypothetical protein
MASGVSNCGGFIPVFDGKPETYIDFASEYYEKTLDPNVVGKIHAHQPLSPLMVAELNPQADWESTAKDAEEVQYPVTESRSPQPNSARI